MLEGRVDKYREVIKDENILYYSHLPASEMQPMITESESIIARSGYTSVMDLISLNCSALLIPTPGQTEQEYLAVYLSEKGWFDTVNQNKLKEEIHIPLRRTLPLSEIIEESDLLLTKALRELLKEADKENLQGESSL
jgi:predicted glycosyltransferase